MSTIKDNICQLLKTAESHQTFWLVSQKDFCTRVGNMTFWGLKIPRGISAYSQNSGFLAYLDFHEFLL